jgi:hypothetical protein
MTLDISYKITIPVLMKQAVHNKKMITYQSHQGGQELRYMEHMQYQQGTSAFTQTNSVTIKMDAVRSSCPAASRCRDPKDQLTKPFSIHLYKD